MGSCLRVIWGSDSKPIPSRALKSYNRSQEGRGEDGNDIRKPLLDLEFLLNLPSLTDLLDIGELCCLDRAAHYRLIDSKRKWAIPIRAIVCSDRNFDRDSIHDCCQSCNFWLCLESQIVRS